MGSLLSYLPYIQITLAVILTIAILLQQRGAGLGGAFGGDEGTIHYERRGSERTLFRLTITLAALFVLSVFISVLTNNTAYIPTQNDTTSTSTENISIENIELTPQDGETFSIDVESVEITNDTEGVETENTDIPNQ
ncbi:MAG: preprotein translocase subunit SecG [Candidatus Pacebacteria bacterium]|nr:preprotein translocase subunit SecG [Candidatus Paceibacterota bacterium]